MKAEVTGQHHHARAQPNAPAPERATDPVCGMTVDREHARHLAEHDGVVYAFCSIGCRTAFIKEPGAYVSGPATAEA